MSKYQVTIVDLPAKRLTGIKVRTSMQKAPQDCPALWQNFGPHISTLQHPGSTCSYGVCVMLNAEEFDYWATVEAASAATPAGMAQIDIPSGPYAKCVVPDLAQLGDAYMYLYSQWLQGQTEYTCHEQAPSFELYPQNWQPEQPLEIYMPLKKNAKA